MGWWKAAGAIASAGASVGESFGSLDDECIVTVRGNPHSSKRELYKLAAAVAFGQTKRWTGGVWGLNPPPGVIMLEHDLAQNAVTFTLRYSRSLAACFAARPLGFGSWLEKLPVMAGPEDNHLGGEWDFVIRGNAPELRFANRPVLWKQSTCPDPDQSLPLNTSNTIFSPNPRPVGDKRSRGTLVSLVFAALSNPGSDTLMKFPVDPNTTTQSINDSYAGGP